MTKFIEAVSFICLSILFACAGLFVVACFIGMVSSDIPVAAKGLATIFMCVFIGMMFALSINMMHLLFSRVVNERTERVMRTKLGFYR